MFFNVTDHETIRNSLQERRIVVTGAGRGLGALLARQLGELGGIVYVSARRLADASRTADEILRAGGTAIAMECDLASHRSIEEFIGELTAQADRVDVLINNGAPWLAGPDLESGSDADVVETLTAGALGTVLLTRGLMPLLRESAAADLVFVVSTAGTPGHVRSDAHPAFFAAKHAVAGFADILAARLAHSQVRVGAVYPGDFSDLEAGKPAAGLGAESVVAAVLGLLAQSRDSRIRSVVFSD